MTGYVLFVAHQKQHLNENPFYKIQINRPVFRQKDGAVEFCLSRPKGALIHSLAITYTHQIRPEGKFCV